MRIYWRCYADALARFMGMSAGLGLHSTEVSKRLRLLSKEALVTALRKGGIAAWPYAREK